MAEEIYQRLAKHLSSLGMGYPEKEELTDILRENFTPLEAEVALALPTKVIPFEPVPATRISSPPDLPRDDLEKILSNLAQRGLLFSRKLRGGGTGLVHWLRGVCGPMPFFSRPIGKKV